jgi:DNA-binding transcriptional LysR family regulator
MDLNETLAFVSVARAGSFTAAAKRLALPKATVSRRVRRLERRLRAQLLVRTTRKVSLTNIGRAFFERCAHAVEQMEDAERAAHDASGAARGTLRLTAPFDFGRDRLAGWLREFRRRYPEIVLEVELTQRNVDLVAEGFDLALRGGGRIDAPGIVRKLAPSGVILCASPAYLKARGVPKVTDDLARHDVLAMRGIFANGRLRLVGPAGPVEVAAAPWLTVNEWGVLRQGALDGLGIALVEGASVAADLRARRLRRVLPELGLPGGGLFALYPTSRHLAPTVRVFIDFLVEKIGREWPAVT